MIHYHHCPECYEVYSCNQACTIEPDLEDPTCHPGKEFGSHCTCNKCDKNPFEGFTMPKGPELYSKEWWSRYHGFTK